ncbi:toll/interleukin-1 receptor domain-containing protein [Brevundimonas sp. AJA228-03]|uniref:toll/interleukin-1 receptor domain-containing protein n=1 Tax=Brevundimonas sp. AJA228-03 TaxID=2752515 RepID=UPI001AE0BFE0|nr:toll/interleukin-1 receptor domain-containing protein [Brevundimonas sp. AJA228-03]QTN20005.1 toll/interleukin-1 receptor domain-containing protein [Brevundimonas sp. AJA228-03]
MPIFISYSQADSPFVDGLARQLVALKHNVWVDRWELKVGDSLTEKIEAALTQSSAVILVISKNSVDSLWCRRELNAALVREIEEKRSIILPCRIDDCEMPLFLRDKLYADFRADPDKALADIDAALAGISNPFQARFEEPEFITDWAVDWMTDHDGNEIIRLHFVDHGPSYVIVSRCTIICNPAAARNFREQRRLGKTSDYISHVLEVLDNDIENSPLVPAPVISDQFEKFVAWNVASEPESFGVVFTYRRMGKDTGFDTFVHLDNNIRQAREHIKQVNFEPDQPVP